MSSILNATTSSGLVTSADNSGSLQLATNNGTTAVTIDTSQNVGIGTTSPTGKLDVVSGSSLVGRFYNNAGRGIVRVDGTSDSSFQAYRNGSLIGWLQTDGSGTEVNTGTFGAFPYSIYTNNTERMRIDSSGNLLVNTTSTLGTTWINLNGVTSTKNGIGIKNGTDTGTIYSLFIYNSSSSLIGSINNNGSATSFTTSSDYRLKENIAPMTGALAKVSALKPVTYKWKSTGEESQGFIAHELAEVCPDAVTGEKDAVDKEGNPKYQGVDTSFLVATLTAAIQEQQAIITDLKTRIETLEAK